MANSHIFQWDSYYIGGAVGVHRLSVKQEWASPYAGSIPADIAWVVCITAFLPDKVRARWEHSYGAIV